MVVCKRLSDSYLLPITTNSACNYPLPSSATAETAASPTPPSTHHSRSFRLRRWPPSTRRWAPSPTTQTARRRPAGRPTAPGRTAWPSKPSSRPLPPRWYLRRWTPARSRPSSQFLAWGRTGTGCWAGTGGGTRWSRWRATSRRGEATRTRSSSRPRRCWTSRWRRGTRLGTGKAFRNGLSWWRFRWRFGPPLTKTVTRPFSSPTNPKLGRSGTGQPSSPRRLRAPSLPGTSTRASCRREPLRRAVASPFGSRLAEDPRWRRLRCRLKKRLPGQGRRSEAGRPGRRRRCGSRSRRPGPEEGTRRLRRWRRPWRTAASARARLARRPPRPAPGRRILS